jgi:hypothetical protein
MQVRRLKILLGLLQGVLSYTRQQARPRLFFRAVFSGNDCQNGLTVRFQNS